VRVVTPAPKASGTDRDDLSYWPVPSTRNLAPLAEIITLQVASYSWPAGETFPRESIDTLAPLY